MAAGYPCTPVSPPADAAGQPGQSIRHGWQRPAPKNPKSSDLSNYLPNLAAIADGGQPVSLGVYDRANKLPYTYNYTLDVQWQPRNDLAIDIGYVGNLGRHQVIPVPFNQPGIAAPSHHDPRRNAAPTAIRWERPCRAADRTTPTMRAATWTTACPTSATRPSPSTTRPPAWTAYNALNAHVDKRMSHGVQVGVSYTYSHALDEQSGLGLFYNGNNPLNLRDGYASADFDRTHVLNFSYVFRVPDLVQRSTRWRATSSTDGRWWG